MNLNLQESGLSIEQFLHSPGESDASQFGELTLKCQSLHNISFFSFISVVEVSFLRLPVISFTYQQNFCVSFYLPIAYLKMTFNQSVLSYRTMKLRWEKHGEETTQYFGSLHIGSLDLALLYSFRYSLRQNNRHRNIQMQICMEHTSLV